LLIVNTRQAFTSERHLITAGTSRRVHSCSCSLVLQEALPHL